MLQVLKKDPRYLIICFLTTYVFYAFSLESFTRTYSQFFLTLIVCVGLDYLLIRFFKKTSFFPLSGLITSFGAFLLCNSPYLWPYIFVAAISIASKHFITSNRQHIFNPNNFGIVIGLLFLSEDMTVEASAWGGEIFLPLLILILGVLIVHFVKRTPLTLSFVATFIVLAFFRSFKSGLPLFTVLTPLSGAAFHLFVFYMISDPKTTPRPAASQIYFGISLGLLDGIFRIFEQKYSIFYSLFIILAIYSALPKGFLKLKVNELSRS